MSHYINIVEDMIAENETRCKVILLGGAPMSGKTTIACMLAAQLKYACLSTDDLGAAIRAVTTCESHPDMHPMVNYDHREYYVSHSTEELIDHAKKQHLASWPAVKAVIRFHALWGHPIVIEGWNLYPEWVKPLNLYNVKPMWLVASGELLEQRIRANRQFYMGASDEELMIQHYLGRSVWHNSRLKQAVVRLEMLFIELQLDSTPDQVCKQCLDWLGVVMP